MKITPTFKAALKEAAVNAINDVGLSVLLATSLFGSNASQTQLKKAA